MLPIISHADRILTLFITNIFPRSEFLDRLFSFLSWHGVTFFVWLIVLIAFITREEYRHRKYTLHFLLSFGITAVFVNIILKNIIQRERPWMVWNFTSAVCPTDYSFPSGHASGAFAGAVIFAHFDPKRKYWYYGLASLISFSRIYLYCHFFLDIAIGALIGYWIGRGVIVVLRKFLSKKKKK